MKMEVIVIGAGAAGLMAAKELALKGIKVLVLEARDRVGGRIHSFESEGGIISEAGAEFIHGNLRVTLGALDEAGIAYEETEGDYWSVQDGVWRSSGGLMQFERILLEKLRGLTEDVSIADFLRLKFPGTQYESLRSSLISYVEGYYAGDTEKTSALSFLSEWEKEDEQQYRITDGYGSLMKYFVQEVERNNGKVELNAVVKQINWSQEGVTVIDANGVYYEALKAVITVPLGLYTAGDGEKGAIKYMPALPEKKTAAFRNGYGAAIKILLHFKVPFWHKTSSKNISGNKGIDFSFAVSNESIPTWWTQLPRHTPVLTGWLAGPKAFALKDKTDDYFFHESLYSLQSIFHLGVDELQNNIVQWQVFNWPADPFTRGGYAYPTLQTAEALKVLMAPVSNTLFFAGDGFYDGKDMGTVESALTSGLRAANEIITVMQN